MNEVKPGLLFIAVTQIPSFIVRHSEQFQLLKHRSHVQSQFL